MESVEGHGLFEHFRARGDSMIIFPKDHSAAPGTKISSLGVQLLLPASGVVEQANLLPALRRKWYC